MSSAVSFWGCTTALAASLALQACGGVTEKQKADAPSTGSGGRPGTGGTLASTGGRSETGGRAETGSSEPSGGSPSGDGSGKGSSGALSYGGKGTGSRLCELPRPHTNSHGEATGVEDCIAGGNHRVSVEECTIRVPREEPCNGNPLDNLCQTDADCVEQPYGECGPQRGGFCACRYGCQTDSDCDDGGVCICSESMGYCAPATCRTDADCEAGYQCRAFQDPTTPLCGAQRFECQTPVDRCNGDDDCQLPTPTCIGDAAGVHHCVLIDCIVG